MKACLVLVVCEVIRLEIMQLEPVLPEQRVVQTRTGGVMRPQPFLDLPRRQVLELVLHASKLLGRDAAGTQAGKDGQPDQR